MDDRWVPTRAGSSPAGEFPAEGRRVDWIAPSGEVVRGGTYGPGRLWFLPGGQVYVYYVPPFWRPAVGGE